MDIGKELETFTITPVEDPFKAPAPKEAPAEAPAPAKAPKPEREKVPA